MMEKYGVETTEVADENGLVKTAALNQGACSHPASSLQSDGDVKFCTKCQKYLVKKKP